MNKREIKTGLKAIRYTLEKLDEFYNFKAQDLEYYVDVLCSADAEIMNERI